MSDVFGECWAIVYCVLVSGGTNYFIINGNKFLRTSLFCFLYNFKSINTMTKVNGIFFEEDFVHLNFVYRIYFAKVDIYGDIGKKMLKNHLKTAPPS